MVGGARIQTSIGILDSPGAASHPARIHFLDGLRCIAVFMVIAYHYSPRWTQIDYPRNANAAARFLAESWPARYGYLGVELFFVISGFVIVLTLYRCRSLLEFGIRRVARLWPAMLLCSVLTYVLSLSIPASPYKPTWVDFVPSLTFISPRVFNSLIPPLHSEWIDKAYWSLFVELRFYVLIGILYFVGPRHFPRNLALTSVLALLAYAAAMIAGAGTLIGLLNGLLITNYLPWFLIGIAFYFQHAGKPFWPYLAIGALGLMSQALYSRYPVTLIAPGLAFPALMWLGMQVRWANRLLSLRWLTSVGVASYSLYLLHQNIGVALIHWLAAGLNGWQSAMISAMIIAVLIAAALAIFRWWEAPWNAVLLCSARKLCTAKQSPDILRATRAKR